MEIKYIRELEHNFMIVKAACEDTPYALKMLQTQPVQRLLPFELRLIDTERYLYYRIDSLQSLENRCLARKMNMEELCALFEALRCAEQELGEYLLGIDSLYLTPETVFLERGSGLFRFTCMPFEHSENGDLSAFTEALLPLVDENDREATAAAYRLCECASETGTRLRDLAVRQETGEACVFPQEKDGQDVRAAQDAHTERPPRTRETEASASDKAPYRVDAFQEEGIWYETDMPGKAEKQETKARIPAKKKKHVNMRILGLLFAVVLLAGIYVRKEYILTPAGNVLSLGVIGVCVAGMAGSFLLAHRSTRETEDNVAEPDRDGLPEDNAGVTYSALWDDLYEGSDPREQENPYEQSNGYGHDSRYVPENTYGREEMYTYDGRETAEERGTVLLAPGKKRSRTAKLYGRDNEHNCHVSLERLPLTLGKLAGHVDFLLRDESVSRIHAHICRDTDGQICVRDLNSTNGTFLNGVRLSPNESVHIREGDEICFGDMVFEYL